MAFSVSSFFRSDESGAISSMYAIAILPLVIMGGVAFDYGRMMGLDTELQNAADQAALAAATQLDGSTDAITNSQIAATNALGNQTRFANDGGGRNIPTSGLTFVYFEGYENDAPVGQTNVPEDAKVVLVNVEDRAVRYALTPIMAAFSGGIARGSAMATMQMATCNVPPMMFCVPNKADGTANTSFPTAADVGRGINLHMNANSADPWAPGNFGFLDIDYETSSGGNPNHTLGLNADFLGCTGEVIESRTGVRDPESDALNSRFDMYNNSVNKNSCSASGDYCPAENVRRNWINVQTRNNVTAANVNNQTCSATPSSQPNAWKRLEDLPKSAASGDIFQAPPSQQLPKEGCLLSGSCGQVLGDGNWDGDAYMATHHPKVALSTAAPNGTRWEVYNWEITNKASALQNGRKIGHYATARPGGRYDVNLYCAYPQPTYNSGLPAGDDQKDRRVLTVAAVDCTGLNGSAPVRILRWVDLFLAQPADTAGANKSFFTEIVGPGTLAGDDTSFQSISRKKAVLLR